jgi:hypothetical protein
VTTWQDLSARVGRRDKPYVLVHAVVLNGELTDPEEIAQGFEDAWVSCEWPGQAATPSVWMAVLGEALDLDTEYLHGTEVRSKDELPQSVTLYRGATPEHAEGMSWTDDRERAEWFAGRFNGMASGEGRVYEVEATPDMVLARFDRRGESEWVLDPEYLDDLQG